MNAKSFWYVESLFSNLVPFSMFFNLFSFLAGKIEVSAIVYKAGECMQELLKSWKEFEASQDAKNGETLQSGPTLEIRIPAEYVTSTNRQVSKSSPTHAYLLSSGSS